MILKRISILNYKNLEEVETGILRQTELFLRTERNGKDESAGCGVLSCLSARVPEIRLILRIFVTNRTSFVIQGFYEAEDGTPEEIYCGMKRRSKKQFKRNKKGV